MKKDRTRPKKRFQGIKCLGRTTHYSLPYQKERILCLFWCFLSFDFFLLWRQGKRQSPLGAGGGSTHTHTKRVSSLWWAGHGYSFPWVWWDGGIDSEYKCEAFLVTDCTAYDTKEERTECSPPFAVRGIGIIRQRADGNGSVYVHTICMKLPCQEFLFSNGKPVASVAVAMISLVGDTAPPKTRREESCHSLNSSKNVNPVLVENKKVACHHPPTRPWENNTTLEDPNLVWQICCTWFIHNSWKEQIYMLYGYLCFFLFLKSKPKSLKD